MSYVGIDFDTKAVHLVRLEEDDGATYERCELEGSDAFERTRDVRRAMPHSSFWDDVVAVAIEEPQGVQKATVAKLKAIQGAILACIPRAKLVEPMVPASWRKVVGLPGNATKQQVADWATLSCSYFHSPAGEFKNRWSGDLQDMFDAYCLALAVSRLVETEAA